MKASIDSIFPHFILSSSFIMIANTMEKYSVKLKVLFMILTNFVLV